MHSHLSKHLLLTSLGIASPRRNAQDDPNSPSETQPLILAWASGAAVWAGMPRRDLHNTRRSRLNARMQHRVGSARLCPWTWTDWPMGPHACRRARGLGPGGSRRVARASRLPCWRERDAYL